MVSTSDFQSAKFFPFCFLHFPNLEDLTPRVGLCFQISLVLHCQPVLALREATTVEYIPGERVEKGSCFDLSELAFVMVGTKQMAIYIYEVLLWFCHVYAFSILYSLFDD